MRPLTLKGYKLSGSKVEKLPSYRKNVSQRKSKRVRISRRAPG
jgi:hypothetical protein